MSDDHDAPYAIRSRYFDSIQVSDTVIRDGLTMTFRGRTYTLEDYASALEIAGFVIETIREPKPNSGQVQAVDAGPAIHEHQSRKALATTS